MKNKDFLTIFISVLAATLFFYGVSAGGALALNNAFSSKHNFGNQSYIGTFDVSNLKEAEAKQLLAEGFQQLEEDFRVSLIYQDATADLPVEAVTYNVDKTTSAAETGLENPIEVSVNEDALRTTLSQNFASVLFSDEDVMNIANGIHDELETGVMPSKVYVSDLMVSNELAKEEIAQANLTLTAALQSLNKVVQSIDGVEIEPFSTFSLLDYLETQDVSLTTNDELTAVASVLYTSILQTNFAIDERSIGQVLHPSVPIGYEASINQALGIDLVFTNPNKSSFRLNMNFDGQQLTSSLTGLPFVYMYETVTTPVMEYEPPIVEQFSAMLSQYEKKIEQEGKNGQEVTVKRFGFDNGVEMGQEIVSTDYYAPIPRIEILPLKEDEQVEEESDLDSNLNEDTNTDSNPDSDTDNDSSTDTNENSDENSDGSGTTSDSEGTSSNDSGTGSNAGSNSNKPSNNGSNDNNNNDNNNRPNNEPNADEKPDVQYDKGGNIIH